MVLEDINFLRQDNLLTNILDGLVSKGWCKTTATKLY